MKNDYIFIESVIFNEGEGTGAILTALKIIDHLLWGEKKNTSGKLLSFKAEQFKSIMKHVFR